MSDDVTGLAFPFRIDPNTGRLALASGRDKIRQNVRLVLSTRYGERPMLRQYGTRIPSLAHDPNDDVLAELVQSQAREALLQWEPRVLITTTTIERAEGELRLRLNYLYMNEPTKEEMFVPVI